MLLRKLNKFNVLREGEAEGGSGGGQSALEQRNAALEARLARTEGALQQLGNQTQQSQQAAQLAQAQARVDQAVNDAASNVDIAERELAAAHDEGDGTKIAAAQRKISEAAAKRERVNVEADNFKRQVTESERRTTGTSSAAPELDTKNLNSWKDRNNEWYGVDTDMTRASHEIDSSVRAAGTFKVGSEDYFKAIDRAMKQRFPNKFAGAPASAGARAEEGGSGNRTPRRYNESIQRGMDAFGMSPESWDAARKKAVDKGLLSAEPARGRIMG